MPRAPSRGACLLLLLCQAGCLYCAYPKLDYTPAVAIEQPEEVRAFRVDATRETGMPIGGALPAPDTLWKVTGWTVAEVSPVALSGGEVPAQIKPSLSSGFFFPLIVVNAFTHVSHSLAVRLYRPGHELVELTSWDRIDRVVWRPARENDEQERAVDALLVGHVSDRDTLLFGASEYERLAAASPRQQRKRRLLLKANALRDRAGDAGRAGVKAG
jgi:hypothetical protein